MSKRSSPLSYWHIELIGVYKSNSTYSGFWVRGSFVLKPQVITHDLQAKAVRELKSITIIFRIFGKQFIICYKLWLKCSAWHSLLPLLVKTVIINSCNKLLILLLHYRWLLFLLIIITIVNLHYSAFIKSIIVVHMVYYVIM